MTLPDPNLDRPGGADQVYAPANERVPVEPVPGHRDFTEHTDEGTLERQAAHGEPSEPSFTRVERPSSTAQGGDWTSSSNPAFDSQSTPRKRGWLGLPMGIGSIAVIACGATGAWLFMRWQRERNKPINRFRRQAMHAADELRDRMPSSPEELRQPAGYGAAASLLPIALVMWRMMQAREQQPIERVSNAEWQRRLMKLRERWSGSQAAHR